MSAPESSSAPVASTSTAPPPSRLNQHTSKRKPEVTPLTSNASLLEKRVTVIKEGDVVMLELPSDVIKLVTVTGNGLVSLGKFGSFPISQLIGRHYNITYEITPSNPTSTPVGSLPGSPAPGAVDEDAAGKKGKKGGKGKGKGKHQDAVNGSGNVLRPRKKARIQELEETDATNELIDDTPQPLIPTASLDASGSTSTPPPASQSALLTPEEISEYRANGFSAEEIIEIQAERHERFGLKTEYSKEKWRKRKEKKYGSFVTPLAPTIANVIAYHNARTPFTILSLRIDTMTQLLNQASIRPGGRYLVVDDTGGLLVAAMLERMGGHGSILLLTENDSPPGWSVLDGMNFDKHMVTGAVKWLNWYEAEEGYKHIVKEDVPKEEGEVRNPNKERMKERKRIMQEMELDATREDLHKGNWDGLVLACTLSPPSVLTRLTPYLAGSANVVVYSPYSLTSSETLRFMREKPEYLSPSMTESWMRKYQVLPMRTHPTMTTSATGGYLVSAIRVFPTEGSFRASAPDKKRKSTENGEGNSKKQKVAADEEQQEAEDVEMNFVM